MKNGMLRIYSGCRKMSPVGWIIGVVLILVIIGIIVWIASRYSYKPPPLQPCNTDEPLLQLPLWRSGGVF